MLSEYLLKVLYWSLQEDIFLRFRSNILAVSAELGYEFRFRCARFFGPRSADLDHGRYFVVTLRDLKCIFCLTCVNGLDLKK